MENVHKLKDENKKKLILVIEALNYLKHNNDDKDFEKFDKKVSEMNYEDALKTISVKMEFVMKKYQY